MHVNLTPILDQYVLGKVKSGRYNNASEVIREALRRMQDQEAQTLASGHLNSNQLDEIHEKVRQGIQEIERGEFKDYDGEEGLKQLFREVRAQGVKQLAAQRRKKAKR